MGAIFGTLVLMTYLGVHITVIVLFFCMFALSVLIARTKLSIYTVGMFLIFAFAAYLNSPAQMKALNIVSNNKYSTVEIIDYDDAGVRELKLNGSAASLIWQHAPETFSEYTEFIDTNFIQPLAEGEKKRILILGAGGFVLGRQDTRNDYTFVDIDGDLKDIAEQKFLQEPLTPNKKFVNMDARAFLLQSKDKYDLVIVDLFRDAVSVPENLTTREFMLLVKDHVALNGSMAGNFFASPTFSDAYSRALDNTMHSVFPNLNRQVVQDFNAWQSNNDWRNIIYSYFNRADAAKTIYTDDKNRSFLDRPADMIH